MLILSLGSLLLTGCVALTGLSGGQKPETNDSGYVLVEQAVDDMPEMAVPQKEPDLHGEEGPKREIQDTSEKPVTRKVIQGFRIQLLTTKSKEEADSLASAWSNELDMKVYKPFESPYFKLRVGNFPTEGDADELLDELKRKGFGNAWVVPDRIYLDN